MSNTTDPKLGEAITIWSVNVKKNEDGELYIDLPNELTDKLNWKVGDDVEWDTSESLGNNFDDTILTLRNLTQETDERFTGHVYDSEK